MNATYYLSLGFAQGSASKTETLDRLVNQNAIQMISTGISLVSLFLGFSIFGILIIVNQRQAELNDLSGGSSYATFGGIGALLVGTAFLVAACHHWRSEPSFIKQSIGGGAPLPAGPFGDVKPPAHPRHELKRKTTGKARAANSKRDLRDSNCS